MVLLILGMRKKKLGNVTDQKRPNHKGFSVICCLFIQPFAYSSICPLSNNFECQLNFYIFFKFNKHLLKKHLYKTKLTLHYSTHITRHHSTYYNTVLIGLVTSTYFLLILTVT